MSGCIVSPEADIDIFEIWRYLFQRAGAEVANRVEAGIYETFEALARHPGLGHKRQDLTSRAVLFFALYSYMIVYRHTKRPEIVEIVRMLHGKRNVKKILAQ